MDTDISTEMKARRVASIASVRPDLATPSNMALADDVQAGIEHACRIENDRSVACEKAIGGISDACRNCVRRFAEQSRAS